MSKKIIIISSLLLIIIPILVAVFFYNKPEYSFKELLEFINPQITENMSLKINSNGIDGDNLSELYTKGNLAYENFYINNEKIFEFTFNYETSEQVNIFHNSKEIFLFKIEKPATNIIYNKLNYYKELLSKSIKNSYRCHSKEFINGNEILKISVDFEENFFHNIDNQTRLYFYINITQKTIDKIDHYNIIDNKEILVSTDNFSYSYNTVTDENLLVNPDDYSNYTYANKDDNKK